MPIPSELEFMAVTSYGSATSSSGVVRILKDLDRDITGRRVVIVEDIIDSGLTLSWLLKNLATRGPAAIDVVALLRKPEAVKVEVDVRYVGFDIPTDFVVGYGLDFAERYRDLPFVGLLARAHVQLTARRRASSQAVRRGASDRGAEQWTQLVGWERPAICGNGSPSTR